MSTTEALLASSGSGAGDRLSIDDALAQHAGQFGRWQLRHFLMVTAAWTLEAMHTMVMIFADREPAMSCPAGNGQCGDRCAGPSAGWAWDQGSASSTVAEWGLVCGESYKVGLVHALYFTSCMIGAGVFGHLSDSFLGRKGSLLVVCSLNAIFGLLTAISPNYWVYVALRILTGFSAGSICLCSFVLATEPVGPSYRGVVGMSTCYFFSGGIAILAGIAAMFQSSWRLLYVVTSMPSLAFMLTIMPFVSESPRWYLVRRRTKDAMRILRDIASTNRKSIPDGITLKLDDEDDIEKKIEESSSSILDVFRSGTTRSRLVLSVLISFLCSVVYYGLSLNVVNLKINIYISVAVNSLAEMPAFLLTTVLLQHLGRKPLAIGSMLLSGVFCTSASLITGVGSMRAVRMACGVVGIFGMAATYNLLVVYTAELFPTTVRTAAMGCTLQASKMGAILAPMVVLLGERMPFAVFGMLGIMGGLLVFFLPETMNKPLYDTMFGLEKGEGDLVIRGEITSGNSEI
ncbi:organic cation/carnitine transporter 4-like [Hordeum vulgare subsp. vulgare]|uniref:H(+)/Pi cotransporter n=1 Tax=Hordeum vulgare subsp. vulgare TaxID=112509 RepID=A0A8I7B3Z8_HORVV|nr:organic cation/carnitine transporter 4-like [Hordeum vulgare subsp. vulgare]